MNIIYKAVQFSPKDGAKEVRWASEQVVAAMGTPLHVLTGMEPELVAALGFEVVADGRLSMRHQLWFAYEDKRAGRS